MGGIPRRGGLLGNVGGILVRELRYCAFRSRLLADGQKLKPMDAEALTVLLGSSACRARTAKKWS